MRLRKRVLGILAVTTLPMAESADGEKAEE